MEHADYIGLRAPKPTILLSSTRDFFDQQGTWITFREAKQAYTRLGYPERLDIIEADEPHGYPKAHREAMARWMSRWLLAKDDTVVEGDYPIAKDADLLCTKTGQVLSELHGKSVFDFNAEREAELARKRPDYLAANGPGKAALLAEVRRLIALRNPIAPAGREDRGETLRDGIRVRKLVFTTEPGIEVPARLFTPGQADLVAPLTVVVGYDVAEAVGSSGPVDGLIKQGKRVLVADLRGMGETSPPPGRPGPLGVGVHEAFLSLHLGRPLLGQRVGDLLAVIAALVDESRGGIDLIGRGAAGPVALHAAALEPRIASLTIEGAIASWSDVVRTPLTKDQLTNVVPGVLASYDLPDLVASLAPRPLTIRAPVDPAGRPASRGGATRP
jgi:hypothetical protein